ncbi:hypothetical protein SLEP1_g23469 [Rubroshorea leprosula]|uniref:Zinc knuckle CX2CX4HX4C domain-containing protein n=1 Tax=Rubroshorea leprosula TaxID=152421 RepID=A0AAV5JM03_9ROSI|nr:hypothetical protein SLEP1_g23469 [Rubroshorea leprosula]
MADPYVQDLVAALDEKLALTADEDVGLDLDAKGPVDQSEGGATWCLVGKLLIRKQYNMEALENTLANLQRVLAEGPWHFANHTMVLKEVRGGRRMATEDLVEVPFWIQIHGVDIRRPLRRGMKLSLKDGPLWVDFRYEHLQNFCYCCGMLDHVDRDCELGLDMEMLGKRKCPYGDTLKVLPRRLQQATFVNTRQWLRDGSGNYVADGARRRRSMPNMESQRTIESSKPRCSNPSLSLDWWNNRLNLVAEPADGNHALNQLPLNGSDTPCYDSSRERILRGNAINRAQISWAGGMSIQIMRPHTPQVSAQMAQNVEMDPVFVFSSGLNTGESGSHTRAWKKEARHGRPTTHSPQNHSGIMKRKEELKEQLTSKEVTAEKRCKGVEEGNTMIPTAGAAMQACRTP